MKKILLIIGLFFAGLTSSFASHLMGADITYTHVSGNDYEVTLTVYRDCSGITVSTTQTLSFISASCGQNFTFSIPYIQTSEVSQVCPSALTTCNGGSNPGTEAYVFQGIVTLPPCSDWVMSWTNGSRNANITNLVNPDVNNIYIENTLNNIIGANNNSPLFFNLPTPYLCANNLAIYSHAATDVDGDSLYYSLTQPLSAAGSPIAYMAGYSMLQPIITTSGVNLNPQTGEMCFTPSQGQIVVVSILIQEYRNGVLIGTQIREMQIVIDPSCTNQNPTTGVAAACGGSGGMTITQQGPTVNQIDDNSIIMCPNDDVCFEITMSDPNGDNITVNSNVASAIPGATFNVTNNGTPNPIATFCWSPTPLDSGLNVFALILSDDACPISGTQTFTYDITIYDQPYAGPDQIICGNQSVQLIATGGAGYTWTAISGDPIIVGTNFSCNPCYNPIASPTQTTEYVVTSSLAAACVNQDTVVVNYVPDFTVTAYGDTTLCDYLTAQLGVDLVPFTGGYTVLWDNAATLNSAGILSPVASPTQTTTYTATVTSPFGCVKQDSATVTVNPPPVLALVPGDTTICQGDALQFGVESTCDYTLEMFDSFGDGWNNQSIDVYEDGVLVGTYTVLSTDNSGDWNTVIFPITNGSTITLVYNTGSYQSESSFNLIDGTGTTQYTVAQGGMVGWIDGSTVFTGTANCGPTLSSYSFDWTPAAGLNFTNIQDPIATPMTTTAYTVTLTSGACSVDRTQTITVVPDYSLTSTQSDSTVCLGETVDFNVTPSNPGVYNYSWSPTGIMSNAAVANPTATFTSSGINTIIVTVDNGGGCIKEDTFYVNVSAGYAPNINIINSDTTIGCMDSVAINLDLGGGIPSSCGPSPSTACSGASTTSTVGTATGANTTTTWPAIYGNWYSNAKHQFLYTAAELNALGIFGGKITEIAWEITQLQSAGGNNGLYNNFTISMGCTSSSALTTTWETGLTTVYNPVDYPVVLGWNVHTFNTAYEWDGISNLVVEVCWDWLAPSTYSNSCITPWTTTTFNSSSYFYSDGTVACTNATASATSTNRPVTRFTTCPTTPDPNIYSFDWSPTTNISDPTVQNPYLFPIQTTTYTVTVTDTLGGCFDTDSIVVTINNPLNPTVSTTDITCNGYTDGGIVVTAAAAGGYEINFYDSLGTTLLQSSQGLNVDSLINIGSGDYFIEILDSSGCSWDTIVTINESSQILLSNVALDTTICIDGSATLYGTGSGGTAPIDLIWDNGAYTGNNYVVNPTDTTTYSVYAQDAVGCQSQVQTVFVDFLDSLSEPTITASRDTICPNESTTLTVNPTTGGISPYTYNWYDGGGNPVGNGLVVTVTPTSSTETYSCVINDNCTTPSVTVYYTIYWSPLPTPSFNVSDNFGCYPITITVNNTTPPGDVNTVQWDWGDGSAFGTNILLASHTYNSPGEYDITLTVTNTTGCTLDTTYADAAFAYPRPYVDFSMNPQPTDYTDPFITFTNHTNAVNPTYSWIFTLGNPSTSSEESPTVEFPSDEAGTYPVTLYVENQYGCEDSLSREVVIDGLYLFYVPSSFSPFDKNGINDYFRAYGDGIDIASFNMKIFNRWGELIFESTNIEKGWDGSYKGGIVEVGTYIWKITVKEEATTIIHENYGSVNIIR